MDGIQADVIGTAGTLADISVVISQISRYQGTVSAAVEEQDATTPGITDGMRAVSGTAKDLSGRMDDVRGRQQVDDEQVARSLAASDALTQLAARQRELVSRFRL